MAKKQYNLDLWKTLEAIDRRDFTFFKELAEDEKKKFAGIVILRWMSNVVGSKDIQEYYILALNETANKHFWNSELASHPELQYLSMARAGSGMKLKHQWLKGPTRKTKTKVYEFLRSYYPIASRAELELFLSKNNIEDLIQIAEMMGMQDNDIKDLKKELKKINE